MAKKKASKPAEAESASKPETCPKCGGKKMGRGYAHTDDCTEAKGTRGRTPRAPKGGDEIMVDGRTKISTLLRLKAQIEKVLAEKDAKEVKKVQEAIDSVEDLERQLKEARALIA